MGKKKNNLMELLMHSKVSEGELPYSKDEINNVLASLEPKDILILQQAYDKDYLHVLDVDSHLKMHISKNIIPKIRRKLMNNRRLVLDAKASLKQDKISDSLPINRNDDISPLDVIKNILQLQTFKEVENILSVEESILLILRLGTSELGQFDVKTLARLFKKKEATIKTILDIASAKYLAYFEKNILKEDGYQKKLTSKKEN